MISIRRRVLLSFLAILTIGTAAVCIAAYLGIRHELDELYDANMRQLARTVSNIPLGKVNTGSPLAFSPQMPHGEEEFLIQIWNDGRLEYSSHPIADFPLQSNEGHGRVFFQSKKWGFYQEDIAGHKVQVSQELYFRRDVIREVYNAVIIPVLVQFPILGLLVWLSVGLGFKPLDRVTALIQKRTADFLDPLDRNDVPKEIQVVIDALNGLLQRLKSSLDMQRRFTADAAHELRSPLTAVRLQLELLRRAPNEHERRDAETSLEAGVERSIRLVQQLLELARQDPSDHTAREGSPVDLSQVAAQILSENAKRASEKSLTVSNDLQTAMADCDVVSLGVLINNLISNAINYTPNAGQIQIKTYQTEKDEAVFEALDNGIGIAENERTRIFDRFYRVLGSDAEGSGLGLSIAQAIADRYRATISIGPGLDGRGTGFKIIFPKPLSHA